MSTTSRGPEDASWERLSVYVIESLKTLNKSVDDLRSDNQAFTVDVSNKLSVLAEYYRRLGEAEAKIEKVVDGFAKFREECAREFATLKGQGPVRSARIRANSAAQIALISAISGIIGSILSTIVSQLAKR